VCGREIKIAYKTVEGVHLKSEMRMKNNCETGSQYFDHGLLGCGTVVLLVVNIVLEECG
jgi:hypothetical protein